MNIKEKLKELPKKPGCYLMKNENGAIIYVGKAKILANRVKSYFVGSHEIGNLGLIFYTCLVICQGPFILLFPTELKCHIS